MGIKEPTTGQKRLASSKIRPRNRKRVGTTTAIRRIKGTSSAALELDEPSTEASRRTVTTWVEKVTTATAIAHTVQSCEIG
jgi:hypothetical protein